VESKEEEANKEVAVAAEENSNNSANSGDSSNSSSGDSQATEAASESALNTSTGSNTSGVSSNSSNVGANTDGNNHAESKNNTESSSNSTSNTQSAGVHMKEQLLYLSKLLDFEVSYQRNSQPQLETNQFPQFRSTSRTIRKAIITSSWPSWHCPHIRRRSAMALARAPRSRRMMLQAMPWKSSASWGSTMPWNKHKALKISQNPY